MFAAKSYNDLRETISRANGIFATGSLLFSYLLILTPAHKRVLADSLQNAKIDPVISSLITVLTVVVIAAIWGYLTTALFPLHDRLYEPHLVNWRASYDADFILRSLCFPYCRLVSSHLFNEAFRDAQKRHTFMQRLFYRFVGDTKSPHQELLERFYTTIRNYWLLVLAEIYCMTLLVFALGYRSFFSPPESPSLPLLVTLIASITFRVWSNRYLPRIRPITIEQVGVIHRDHKEDFETELHGIVQEYHLEA